jgi:hypothetical protein
LLIASATPCTARAAAPDPSPQPPAATSAPAPSPDPAPQAQTGEQSQAAPATPRPTESGVALGTSASEPPTSTTGRVTVVPIPPLSVVPRSRPVSSHAHGRAARTTGRSTSSQLLRRSRGLFDAIAGVAAPLPTPHRSGVLLLLAALALGTLVVASSSLLRLLGRMSEEL